MIGIVLIAHGTIGDELRSAVENMLGTQTKIATVAVEPDDPLATRHALLDDAVKSVAADGEGVLILTDMFGGTPCNVAVAVPGKTMVIAGVNLPMLVTACRARKRSGLLHVAQSALEAGKHYIGFAEPPRNGSGKAAEWSKP